MFMKDNKGFSLVELIVAFAILAIAGIAVFGMMSAGSNNFRRTGNDVGLQYEQQIVVNKLRDVLLESTNAISYTDNGSDPKTLLVYNLKDMGPVTPGALTHDYDYEVTKIFLSKDAGSDTGRLMQVSAVFTDIADVNIGSIDDDVASLLGEDVKDVDFDLSDIEEGKIGFKVWFYSEEKEMYSEQVVSLRNKIITSDDPDKIFVSDTNFTLSYIEGIIVNRVGDPTDYTQGMSIDIDLAGDDEMIIPFTYKVKTNRYSELTYYADWSLVGTLPGVTIDQNSGELTVDPTVLRAILATPAAVATIDLRCSSLDDRNIHTDIELNFKDGGVYPASVTLCDGTEYTNYLGYREYRIYPKVVYTDGTYSNDSDLCTWVIGGDQLPEGCEFDPATNKFTATNAANGLTVTFQATCKVPSIDGTRKTSEVLTIHIEDVPDYIVKQKLSLGGIESIYNNRGAATPVYATWSNSTYSNFEYHWTVEPIGENWNNDISKKKFSETIKRGTNQYNTTALNGEFVTSSGNSFFSLYCEEFLDWSNQYTVKVSCYAVNLTTNKKYGIGNEVDGNYEGPVELEVTYEPVKCVLVPTEEFHQNSTSVYNFISDRTLRRSSSGKKDATNNYIKSSQHDGKTVRMFEIKMRGVLIDSSNNSELFNNMNLTYDFFDKTAIADGDSVVGAITDPFNKKFYGKSNYGYSSWLTGFYIDMNDAQFKTTFEKLRETRKPAYIRVIFRMGDGTKYSNQVEAYYLTGSDYYSDNDLTKTSEYKFPIKYDPKKLGDADFVEILR